MKKIISLFTTLSIVFGVLGTFTVFAQNSAADLEISTLEEFETFRDSDIGTEKTEEQFASGEAAYLLNGSTSEGELNWYQNIGKDNSPVLDNTHLIVLYDGTKYYNDKSIEKHIHKICSDANCTDNHGDIEWTAWNSADTLPTETGNYYLTKDVTISLPWSPEDGTALCLNGHSIRQTDKLCVIRPGGVFSLCDCAGGGTVTGGALGVAVMGEENVFNMYGGKITENHWKGGVFDGGGVVCYDGGVFNMYGGEISSNSSDAIGGVTVWGQMSIGGKAVIRDNTNAGGVMENLFLSSDSIITVNSPITDGSYIGIAYYPAFMRKFPKTISGANDADYSQYFHSDNATYKIINGENNVLQFVYKNNSYPYYEITDVFAVDTKNNTLDVIPPNTEFTVYAPIEQIAALEGTNYGTVILAAYDEDGALIDIGTEKITNPEYFPCAYTASLHSDEQAVGSVKAFVWNAFNSMEPLAETKILAPIVFN